MTRPLKLALGLLIAARALPADSATLRVPADYPTIQTGINAAAYGDTVEIACGTYTEFLIQMKSGVTLRSATGLPDCVIIDPSLTVPIPDDRIMTCPGDQTTAIEGITFRNSDAEVIGSAILCTGSPRITDCRFENNSVRPEGSSGGAVASGGGTPVFVECAFEDNRDCAFFGGSGQFMNCHFIHNTATDQSSGGAIQGSGTFEFVDCEFINNEAYFAGGAISAGGSLILARCLFVGNQAAQEPLDGGGALRFGGSLIATDCTFYGNGVNSETARGTTMFLHSGSYQFVRCIISAVSYVGFEAVHCEMNATVSATCTNIYGPPQNTWVGCLAGQLGQNGNISADPVFCNAAGSDFHLSSISPCLDAPCGTMGAFGLGCYDAKPSIISIKDVGNDQGRQARLTWYRAQDDFSGSPFDGYAIYRRQDLYAAAPSAIQAGERGPFAIPGWDYITTIPDRGDDIYQAVVPTLCDSTITSGQCWSAFFVSALTPTTFYDSPVDSGYSKDNLAPPTPTSFTVDYNTGSGNHLAWDGVAANDFAGFRVYRGATPGFVPSPATLVHSTTQTTWNDPVFDGWGVSYKVTSFDLAGNESAPTNGGIVTGAGDRPQGLTLELGANVPNPFNPSTTIPFVVPFVGQTRIAIYDVRGGLVRVLLYRALPAGANEAVWDGRNDAGVSVSSGLYLCRLEHPAGVSMRKLMLIK